MLSTLIKLLILGLIIASVFYLRSQEKSQKLPLLRHFFNCSALFAPYNVLMRKLSKTPSQPLIERNDFRELDFLKENWQTIKAEAERLFEEGYIQTALDHNEAGFNSLFKNGWKRFHLTWYHGPLASAKYLSPKTLALLEQVPSVKSAMFARLPPRSHLNARRGLFGGSLGYHLGLSTPNAEDCAIYVDKEPQVWHDGEDFIFDQTYTHWVINDTDQARLILFCNIERPLPEPMAAINRKVGSVLAFLTTPQNMDGEHVGVINRFNQSFTRFFDSITAPIAKLKRYSKRGYDMLRNSSIVVLLILLCYWIF